MRIANVIGRVTLNKCHPSLQGATWLVAVPLTLEGLAGKDKGRGEPFVVYDEFGAGQGARIAVSEGTEAAAPFYPATKPIDAYNAAILDTIELESL
ncbi:MAG: carbon dioxide concentrating mechanism protein CcmL [Planctomycetaceae bacterium]|nr:carbon dioxide concentrating mechanism protein CcmL [Planctomycetaceae bacterium]